MAEVRETNTAASAKKPTAGSKGALPTFEDNPMQAIGLALQNFAAGFRGQPLPTDLIQEREQQRKLLEMKQLGLTLDAVHKGVELFGGADPDNPQLQQFVGQFSEALPGFGDAFNTALEIANTQGVQALAGAGEHREKIYTICGLDRECIKNVISDSDLMGRFNETADSQRMPSIVQKFQAITEGVGGEPELRKLIGDGEWTLGDLRQLPEGFAFTKEELRTIERNEDIQNSLIEFGFVPPSISAEGAKAEAKSSLGLSVKALVEAGVPRDIAVKTRTGAFKGVTDSFGRASVVDVTTGQKIWPPDEAVEPVEPTKVEAPSGLSEATGGQAVLESAVNTMTDFFGAGLQFENTQRAVDLLTNLKTFTTLGLSQELATRDTNMVRSMLENLLPDAKKLTVGDAKSLSKLETVRDQLRFILEGEQEVLQKPGSFPPDMVQKASAAVHNLSRLVEMYDGIIDNWYEKPGAELPEGIPEGSKEIGTYKGNPVYETPDGKRLVVE